MKSINLSLDLFRDFSPACIREDEVMLNILLEALVARNCQWLLRRPDTPLLYPQQVYLQMGIAPPNLPSSGVYYQLEPNGEENFDSIPKVLRMGSGDCDDLCAFRAAECRVRFGDVAARVIFVGEMLDKDGDGVGDYMSYHVLVRRGDGTIEDPSLILGMNETPEAIQAEVEADGEDDVPEMYPEGDDWRWAA